MKTTLIAAAFSLAALAGLAGGIALHQPVPAGTTETRPAARVAQDSLVPTRARGHRTASQATRGMIGPAEALPPRRGQRAALLTPGQGAKPAPEGFVRRRNAA